MEHCKVYQSHVLFPEDRRLIIEGPVPPEQLSELTMHPDLKAFRHLRSSMRLWWKLQACPKAESSSRGTEI